VPNEPIAAEELADLLIEHGYAEEQRGYGHAAGEEVAEWLTTRFVIYERANDSACGVAACAVSRPTDRISNNTIALRCDPFATTGR